MSRYLTVAAVLAALMLAPVDARAHCGAVDGPVATAAVKALDTGNVRLVFPYVPQTAEAELESAFQQAGTVRRLGPDAKALADRYFMETAVRLHRAGEGAPYTGLRPAGIDFGPAIPAAEKALESGDLRPVLDLLTREIAEGVSERFEHARALRAATKEPSAAAQVPAARERVSTELAFIGYVEGVYLTAKAGGHVEGRAASGDETRCE